MELGWLVGRWRRRTNAMLVLSLVENLNIVVAAASTLMVHRIVCVSNRIYSNHNLEGNFFLFIFFEYNPMGIRYEMWLVLGIFGWACVCANLWQINT